jgi:VIT1/CCC1 family predicted Fe2+/Mn2+ transporter
MSLASVHHLPFSTSTYKPNFSSVLKNILMMMLGGLVGIIHYFIYSYTWLVLVLIVVSLASAYFLFGIISKYSWRKIISEYRDD